MNPLLYRQLSGLFPVPRCFFGRHDWQLDMFVIDTNPLIHHRQCRRCEKKDHTGIDGKWKGKECFCHAPH